MDEHDDGEAGREECVQCFRKLDRITKASSKDQLYVSKMDPNWKASDRWTQQFTELCLEACRTPYEVRIECVAPML